MCCVHARVDDIEREAIRNEGLDPDDDAVVMAIDLVRWELSIWVPADPRSPRECCCRNPHVRRSGEHHQPQCPADPRWATGDAERLAESHPGQGEVLTFCETRCSPAGSIC